VSGKKGGFAKGPFFLTGGESGTISPVFEIPVTPVLHAVSKILAAGAFSRRRM
jgi:hypothetical protein